MSAESETPLPSSAETPATEMPAAEVSEAEALATPLEPKDMDRYECRACGYDYEPVKGDDRGKIPAGVPFEEIPNSWKCPVCGAQKTQFSNIGPAGSPSGFKENLGYGLGVNAMPPGQKNILIFGSLALAVLFFLSLYGLR
ncbi:MAG: rubredoxin [Cyanobacteria bacterium Co-bin8]|nr:rubredoxin [Pseudanabaena sp. FACHB-2040]MBD0268906.1 rubredoxin [Cyanobacteria bacterium Co-bin8]MBD2257741.1 rubredoxin [Pseudanabaena sp. FACHB-2040]